MARRVVWMPTAAKNLCPYTNGHDVDWSPEAEVEAARRWKIHEEEYAHLGGKQAMVKDLRRAVYGM